MILKIIIEAESTSSAELSEREDHAVDLNGSSKWRFKCVSAVLRFKCLWCTRSKWLWLFGWLKYCLSIFKFFQNSLVCERHLSYHWPVQKGLIKTVLETLSWDELQMMSWLALASLWSTLFPCSKGGSCYVVIKHRTEICLLFQSSWHLCQLENHLVKLYSYIFPQFQGFPDCINRKKGLRDR